MPRIIFFGTSDFAVPSLKALSSDGHFEIVGVVTQPDRPVGRHAEMTPPAVKKAAQGLGISTILQPEKIKDEAFQTWINTAGPTCDAFVVISYGKILPQWLLDLPKKGVVNIHGSVLPRWRGASPIQAAISAGDTESGVTIMQIDAEMDHGPTLAIETSPIRLEDTGESLHDRLADLGAALLPKTLTEYLAGNISPVVQDHAAATYCKILTRDDGKLDWTKPADELVRLIRAYHPWPGTWTVYNGKRLKIQSASVITGDDAFAPGRCFIFESQPAIACADGTALLINTLQLEGRPSTDGRAFMTGARDWENGALA